MGLLGALFGRRLWLTNTVSCGALLAAGDGIQQLLEFQRGVHAEEHYNWKRTGRMFAVGLSQGPPHHLWYTWLDRWLPGRSGRVVRLKILADQLVAAPFFAVTFFLGAGLLEGHTVARSLQEFQMKFPEVYLFDWAIWPPTQWINFRYVPEPYRVLYVNVVTVVWDVFLSYIKHRDQLNEDADPSCAAPDPGAAGGAAASRAGPSADIPVPKLQASGWDPSGDVTGPAVSDETRRRQRGQPS
ncbi:mpv17-like protein 2 [Pollicipes pollicipes]|uniref:mpv17-like protein 2 n=1 Tax=Pollicipes pollicipes TaxID=41117 RepID=UPI001885058B|nr:mpv17-like protein 2 [Pollicipes pollicipes]